MKFTNWKSPSVRQLLKEYKIEHDMKGNKFWGSKREFIDAVRNAKVERITREADQAIDYRSGTKDKGQLLNLIKGYRSYPKYRNEGTLNAIYDGYAKNAPMDRPIVVDFGKGGRRVFAGNTRMDAAFHSGVDPEVLVVKAKKFAAKLTGGQQGMKLKEFRYYPYPGSPYGPQPMRGYENPYGKDFYEDREKERKHGLLKAGLIGAGLLGGGALAGRGLFKAGISAAARRSDDLVRANASLTDELAKLRKAAAEAPAPAPKAPRVAPKQSAPEAPVIVPEMVAPAPPVVPAPAPPNANPPQIRVKRGSVERTIPVEPPKAPAAPVNTPAPEGSLAAQSDAAAEALEKANATGELTEAEKFSQTSEQLREWNRKKLADQAEKKPRGRKKTSTAVEELPPKAKAAVKRTAKKRADSNFNRDLMERKKAEAADLQQKVDQMNQRLAGASNTTAKPAAVPEGFTEEMAEPKKKASGKKKAAGGSKKKVTEASVPHEIYKGHKVFTDPAFIEKWGSVEAQKKIIDRATGLTARLRGLKEFNFVADEAGVPFTGKVARDRFIKKLRDEDLDRRDANILRAGATGAVAGLLFRGRLSRGKRALIGAGLGGAGVIGARMATDRTRDIYGERSRGAKRAELAPAIAGLGAAGWLATRRIRGLSTKLRGVKEFARGKYAIPALGKMLKEQSFLEEFVTGHRGPKLGDLRRLDLKIVRDMKTKLAGNPKLARVLAKRNIYLGPGRLTQVNTDARNWTADALRRGKKGGAILTPENHLRVGPVGGRRETYIVWPPRNLETTDLAARLRGVKEFGSMGVGKLYRKKAALLKRGLFVEKINPSTGQLLYTESRPLVSDRERYAGIYRRLANKGAGTPNVPPWKQNVPVGGKLQSPYDGKMQQELKYDEVMRRHEKKVRGFAAKIRGVKEFARGFNSAKLLPSERWESVRDPFSGWVSQRQLPAPERHSAYSKYVADKMRAVRSEMRRLNGGNIPYIQRARELKAERARAQASKSQEWIMKAQSQLPDYYFANQSRFSARLRGLKEFEDYKLYYFRGRNTGIAARSAEEARKKKKRGGDELVAVRTPTATEKSQMARGIWVRTRRDGKSPGKSRYGKGRGQGPARKSMAAKLRVKFFEKKEKSGGLNPYVGAALSGGASGALLGGLSILRRGVKPMAALGTAAKLGGVSAGIVGGGALLGSRIVGKPREDEGAPFTKRAGIGGAIAGAGVGLAGALALRKTRGGARLLVNASKNWRPAMWVRKSPLAAGAAVGTVAGALYGGAQGLDEGQQVDSIRNLKKDIKTHGLSRRLSRLREFGVFQNARKWYRGENMNGMQRMALAQARKVSPRAAQALKAGFIKDNHSANKLVLGAGVVPPVLTTGIGVAATYHSAGLGKKKEQEMSAKFFGRRDQPRWYSPGTNEHGQFGDIKVGWVEDRPMFTEIRKTQRDGKVVKEVIPWEPSSPQLVNALLRDAKNQRVNVQRGGRLTRDIFDEIRGAERRRDASGRIKKREWEKSWFQNKAQEIGIAAAGGAGLLTARYAHNNPHTKVGQAYANAKMGLRETRRNVSDIGGKILKTATEITRRRFSAKLAKLRELDAMAEYAGWDVRDPRGRSARVFAPGSRRRERRPKEWYEKTENERKLWKAGIAAGVLGGAGLALVGQRLVSGKSLIPSRFVPKQPNPEVFVDATKMFRPGAA